MKTAITSASLFLVATLLSSCHSPRHIESIERTRIVVDARFDKNPDSEAASLLAPYTEEVSRTMDRIVGTVAHDMSPKRPESDLSNLLPDILVWAAKDYGEKPDFGIYNIGGIRADLTKGPVTYGDVLDVAPFENKICFLSLKGNYVEELFRQIAARGGEGVSHGVELVITSDGKLLSAKIHGKDISPDKSYRITTIDYLSQGNDQLTAFTHHTDLNSPDEESNNTRYIIRDYFLEMQKEGKAVDAKIENRITVSKQ